MRGTWSGDSFTGDPGGYVKKALETGICLHRGPTGNLKGGSFTRDFERWTKETLEVESLSVRALCEGNLEGGLLYWRP